MGLPVLPTHVHGQKEWDARLFEKSAYLLLDGQLKLQIAGYAER